MELPGRWVHENLFSRNGGYFQIDGNSGFTASLVEMFLQSHAGVIHLGPAIPQGGLGLSSGSFKGWVARGAFKVDMEWKEGNVIRGEITSTLGYPLKVRVGSGQAFWVDDVEILDGEHKGMETTAGETYTVSV